MGLESGTYVSDFVPSNPVGASDPKSQGDDHLRLIKTILQATFPNASKPFRFPDVLAKTASYTILSTDENKLVTGDATGGAFTLTLPTLTAAQAGWRVRIMKIDSSANAVTVGGTINGISAGMTLNNQWESAIFEWTGSVWASEASGRVPLRVVTKTATATLTAAEMQSIILATPGAASITLTLPAATRGDWVYVKNLHASNDVVIDPPGAVTIDGAATLTVDEQYEAVLLVSDGTNWHVVEQFLPTPAAPPISAGFKNLVIVNTVGNENTQIDIDADAVTVETSAGIAYRLRSVNLTINTAAANGANAMDAGGLANNTWYYSFVIYNPTTNTVAGLLSASATAPTLPSGYTAFARFGTHRTDGSAQLKRTIQKGRCVQYVVGTNPSVAPSIATGAAGTYDNASPTLAAASISGVAPPTASKISLNVTNNANGSGPRNVIVAPNSAWGGTNNGPGGSNGNVWPIMLRNTEPSAKNFEMMLESTNIHWASEGTGGAISCLGWEDNI